MKKVFMLLAVCASVIFADAQTTVRGSKFTDNWSVGVQAGGVTRTYGHKFFGDLRPVVGLTVAKEITPVFGLAAEFNAAINAQHNNFGPTGYPANTHKAFDASNLSGLLRVNLVNLIKDYTGEPGFVDVKAVFGFGWGHEYYGHRYNDRNLLTSKAGLDFGFNIGADKAWQLYIEPSLTYNLHNWLGGVDVSNEFQYDARNAYFGLKAGVNYKFGNSNGSHNFKIEELRDQAEIDGLNAKINELRADNNAKDGQLSAKDQQIADLKAKLAECEARPVQVVEKKEEFLQPHVIFRQGKSVIDAAQYASIEMVAKYMKNHKDAKVKVLGYASPEGNAELNQKLSEKRAEVVKNALIKKYKIAADRITCEGLGATDKLSSENDFNRVAMFIDTTK